MSTLPPIPSSAEIRAAQREHGSEIGRRIMEARWLLEARARGETIEDMRVVLQRLINYVTNQPGPSQ